MQEDKSQERQFEFRNKENQEAGKGENEEYIYNSNEYISKAKRVKNGTVPMNILEFHHSFSYDCQRYFNLCVAEPNIIIFISGNILHFWNISTNKLWFRRGYTGDGIGHKNPVFDHIAVGENGIKPPIIIYKWPSMDIVTILYNGTLKSYSHLAYSADGLLLVSQGGDPDYTITLWNWQKSKIALKCKSYNRDVYNITISSSLPGYLVTSGSGHIKFWKISETFTGLKLKGEIGRFGQTEISDIIGVYIMPDGKVVSGCEWGNILLWEEGLITLEICKKNRQSCHTKAITQFEYINGELISVGMDGWIRIWFYETIDQADSRTGERFLEIQPIYEHHVSEDNEANNSMLMCIRKQELDNPESMLWYVQDGNGGIWLIDLHTPKAELPRKIFTCHAGAIADMDYATWGPFIVTLGKAGQLHIYNYTEKKLILVHNFNDIGSQIIWFSCQIEATGSTLACAFESGVIRIIVVAISTANAINNIRGDYVRLIQVIKPHKMAITTMSLNPSCSLLVTGSEDSTIFSFTIIVTNTYPVITPVGFIKVPSGVTCLAWKPQCETTILIGCSQGDCVEVTLPNTPQSYTIASYELVQCRLKTFKFYSVKSAIRNELIRLNREKGKKEKIAKKREEIARLIVESPEMEINEEAFFINMEEEESLPEIYIPKIPNMVLIAQYISQYVIWLLMAGFDAGYIYEYPSPQVSKTIVEKPIKSTMIYDADDVEIRSCLFYKKRKYLFLGMEHGQIRICKLKPENYTDLSDYWILSMHDNFNGYIPKIILSHNQKMLFTCGYDGNLFSYEINDDTPSESIEFEIIKGTLSLPYISIEDIEDADHASLEEMIQQTEHDRIATVAKQSKHYTLQMLSKLSEEYSNIMERNNALPKSHRITREELELDPRIIADLNKELEAEMITVREKLAFKIEKSKLGLQKLLEYFIQPITHLPFAICKISKPDNLVYSLRQHILNIDVTLPHINTIKHVHAYTTPLINTGINGNSVTDDKMQNYEEKEREKQKEGKTEEEIDITQEQSVALFLNGLNYKDTDSSLGIQLNQMLNKYNLRKTRLEQREKEWKIIYNEKPDKSINHMHDIFAIEEARKTIGDYKLKTSSTFNLQSEERDTLFSKYKQLLKCQKKLYYLQEAFNMRLKAVRTEKEHLLVEIAHLKKSLKHIHAEIPLKSIKSLPDIPTLNINVEFPERKVMIEKYTELKADRALRRLSVLPEQIPVCSDEEYEVLLLDEKFVEHANISSEPLALFSVSERKLKIQSVAQDNMMSLHLSDDIDSPWEREMKTSRILYKIYKQDCILKYALTSCENLDKELNKLEYDRLDIVADNVNINLFLLTLRQEYIILREYETRESILRDQVNCKLEEVATIRQKIQIITDKVDVKIKEITKLRNQIKNMLLEYMSRINDNKFRNFLCRIFKKKYKESKEEDETTTTTTETSSDETNSIDTREFELAYFDENTCPPGCDKKLYDLAFSMREKRYSCEHQIKDAQQTVEIFHKEIQIQTKKLKLIESSLKKNEEDLNMFMLEKQKKLNNVDVTVIMKLHQLQYFEEYEIPLKLHDCVLFDKNRLAKLYARIQELHEETLELHVKHKRARMHLQRIKVDCNHMRVNNNNLKNEIKLKIINKFGQNISLNKLYETILRRMVYDIKANLNETMYFTKRIKHVKESYAGELVILNKLIREHTQKLSFLTILVEEQSKLQKLSKQHIMSDEEMLQLEEKYKNDIVKLKKILENQTRQKYLFQNDIKNLKLKIKSQFNPIEGKDAQK
ncbi:cilia- and flagella-associated protein 44 isoform X2 [Polyergus mexicanus]|uniref:cilia- and flagella-associated protein 44 isoform X2 n=1 Tax=Polyergus mexicanus TaxID=615972 RepID=UPI0038B4F861